MLCSSEWVHHPRIKLDFFFLCLANNYSVDRIEDRVAATLSEAGLICRGTRIHIVVTDCYILLPGEGIRNIVLIRRVAHVNLV